MPRFPVESEACLKEAMLTIAQRDGFDKCYFDQATVEALVARAKLTQEQVLEWAHHARMYHAMEEDMQFYLRLCSVNDQGVKVGRFFTVGIASNAHLIEQMLVIPKSRIDGQFDITGQVGSWNETTKELRLFVEKEMTTTKVIMDCLTLAGATQVQISSFPRNDPKPAQWALRNVIDHGGRPGSRVVTHGTIKTKLPPATAAAEGPKKAADAGQDVEMADPMLVEANAKLAGTTLSQAETIAQQLTETERIRTVSHQICGKMGAEQRKKNVPIHAQLEHTQELLRIEIERRIEERERHQGAVARAENAELMVKFLISQQSKN